MPRFTWLVQVFSFLLSPLCSCQQNRWGHRAIEHCLPHGERVWRFDGDVPLFELAQSRNALRPKICIRMGYDNLDRRGDQ